MLPRGFLAGDLGVRVEPPAGTLALMPRLPSPCAVCGVLAVGGRCNEHPRVKRNRGAYNAAAYKRARGHLKDEIARAGGTVGCHWCGRPITCETFQADHVIPLAQGGANSAENIVAACRTCNASRTPRVH